MADAHIKRKVAIARLRQILFSLKRRNGRWSGTGKYYYKMKEGKINGANSICSVGQTACQTITGKSLLE
jgi:hypothetical protein